MTSIKDAYTRVQEVHAKYADKFAAKANLNFGELSEIVQAQGDLLMAIANAHLAVHVE